MAVSGSIAPGARILCRDVEWLVKSIARSVDGGRIIEAVGVSEFIRGKTARFVDELEPDLKVLDPKETELVGDESSGQATESKKLTNTIQYYSLLVLK
jgi:hypothetical protein